MNLTNTKANSLICVHLINLQSQHVFINIFTKAEWPFDLEIRTKGKWWRFSQPSRPMGEQFAVKWKKDKKIDGNFLALPFYILLAVYDLTFNYRLWWYMHERYKVSDQAKEKGKEGRGSKRRKYEPESSSDIFPCWH